MASNAPKAPKSHSVALTVLGFVFGLALALFLVLTGVVRLDSVVVEILPLLLAVLGLVLGLLGRSTLRRRALAPPPPSPEPAAPLP